jgi:dienelactone hydrolase
MPALLIVISSLAPALAQPPPDRFVAPVPSDGELFIRSDVEYARAGDRSLRLDFYRPRRETHAARVPVVVFFNGVGGDWLRKHVQYMGWGRYVTTRGFAGVTMDATEATATADFDRLKAYLDAHAEELGVDPSRLVLWSCSANVRSGLPLSQDPKRTYFAGSVVYYGTGEVQEFRRDMPLLLVRAGTDNPGLNRGMNDIAARALAANAPVSVVNYPAGRHGFDIRDDTDESRAVMAQTLDFIAMAVDPGVASARRGKIRIAEAAAAQFRGDWAAAAKAYEALAADLPRDAEVQQRLGEALAALGEHRRSIPAFERSLELGTPNRGIVTFALIRTHAKLGEIDRAFAWVEKLGPVMRFFAQPLRNEPDFAALRADPRFEKLVPR